MLYPSHFYADDEYEEMVRLYYWDAERVAFWKSPKVLTKFPFLKQYPFWRTLYQLHN